MHGTHASAVWEVTGPCPSPCAVARVLARLRRPLRPTASAADFSTIREV